MRISKLKSFKLSEYIKIEFSYFTIHNLIIYVLAQYNLVLEFLKTYLIYLKIIINKIFLIILYFRERSQHHFVPQLLLQLNYPYMTILNTS